MTATQAQAEKITKRKRRKRNGNLKEKNGREKLIH